MNLRCNIVYYVLRGLRFSLRYRLFLFTTAVDDSPSAMVEVFGKEVYASCGHTVLHVERPLRPRPF